MCLCRKHTTISRAIKLENCVNPNNFHPRVEKANLVFPKTWLTCMQGALNCGSWCLVILLDQMTEVMSLKRKWAGSCWNQARAKGSRSGEELVAPSHVKLHLLQSLYRPKSNQGGKVRGEITKSLKVRPQTIVSGRWRSSAHSLFISQAGSSDEHSGDWCY